MKDSCGFDQTHTDRLCRVILITLPDNVSEQNTKEVGFRPCAAVPHRSHR